MRATLSKTPLPTATPTLAPPTNLTGTTVSNLQINLAWTDNSSNESGFKLERCAGVNCTAFTQIYTTTANIRSYASTGLVADTTYCYRLRAYNSGGNSAYANTQCRTTGPLPPTSLTANRIFASEVNLFWVETSGNESGFKLERCLGITCTNFIQIALLPANAIGYHDTGLSANSVYRYRVAGYNANGNSAYSNIVNVTTPLAIAAAQSAAVAPETATSANEPLHIMPLHIMQPRHQAQLISNLKISGKPAGLLLNFGSAKPEFMRKVFTGIADLIPPVWNPGAAEANLIEPALALALRQAAWEVYRELGAGFVHRVYVNAMHVELRLRGIAFQRFRKLTVMHRGHEIGKVTFHHFLVDGKIVFAPVTVAAIGSSEVNKVRAILAQRAFPLGMIVNFQNEKLEVRYAKG